MNVYKHHLSVGVHQSVICGDRKNYPSQLLRIRIAMQEQ